MITSKIEALSKRDITKIHNASLDILEHTGIKVENEKICKMCRDQGCPVDGDIVRFPTAFMENLLNKIKAAHAQGQVKKEDVAELQMIASAQSIYILDMDSDKLRPATRKDLADATRLVDALQDVALGHAIFIPSDVPKKTNDLHLLLTTAENSSSIAGRNVCINSPEEVDYAIEMGIIIRGSLEELKKNPCFCHYCCATSPHVFGKTGLDITMRFHERGLGGVIGGVMILPGATAPVTLAGTLVVQTVDSLAAMALTWILDGRFGGYGGQPAILDMRELVSCQGAPEFPLLLLATKQMADYYGTPMQNWNAAFQTDSKFPDVQAGMEKAYKVMIGLLAGFRSFSELGTLADCLVSSLPLILVDRDMVKMAERFLRGINVNDETLALDLIRKQGIGANYIAEEHTVKHFKTELWMPSCFDRKPPGQCMENYKTAYEIAKDKTRTILKEHQP
ncbi:MAG: trimethylamine methyltransferase family protein, partial [Verrucomicrobia bacterium]|nr:trimethylamine methyltransferase family protein [Verrucomicrobiota bacterium]